MKKNEAIPYPRIRNLPEDEREAFSKWLWGQTRPLIEGAEEQDQDFYYEWDYQRWKKKLPVLD